MEVGTMTKDVGLSIPGRLGLTSEDKETLYRFLRNEIGREGIRALVIIWFDEGRTEAEIGNLLYISSRNVRRWIRRYREAGILGLHDGERTGRPRKADEKVEIAVEDAMKKNPEEVGYKSGFWVSNLLCIHLFAIFGLLLSDNTVRRVLHRMDYVFRRPKLWSGPGGEKPPEIEKAIEEVKKRKRSSFIRMKQASTSYQY
ncbi:helix-turn-helix domain-containing protein [Candidatus Methanoperedens nitratireducens]|nr:helix-turn-helix domain-containing protein [Candidatus Methanoperedens nitroreducens]